MSRRQATRKQSKTVRAKARPWHHRLDWLGILFTALLLAIFFLPQRTGLESGWFQLTARFHPQPVRETPWLLVQIDQNSMNKLGNWPWDQRQFTLIVEQLLAMQPDGLVILQQPPSHWNRDSLKLLQALKDTKPAEQVLALGKALDNPQRLYQLNRLYYASLPGEGMQNWPEGLPASEIPAANRWQEMLNRLFYLLQGKPAALTQGGQFLQRPAHLIQAPLLRGHRLGEAHRPAWFELDGKRTPTLALRILTEQAGQPLSALHMQPGGISLGAQHWKLEQAGRFWPSLHPGNLPRISLQSVLNGAQNIRGRWIFLAVTHTLSSADERLEAQATASLYQHNQSYMPWFVPLLQGSLLIAVGWILRKRGDQALDIAWVGSIVALALLQLIGAQVLQGWLHWWIQPAWPALALLLLLGMHWLRHSSWSPAPDKALTSTRLKLARSLLEQGKASESWAIVRKLPASPSRFQLLENLLQHSQKQGKSRLEKQILDEILRSKPSYKPAKQPKTGKEATQTPDATKLDKTDILQTQAPPGDDLQRYDIVEELGRGAMAVVYRARDEKLGREVALKVLPLTGSHREGKGAEIYRRFMQEARAAARLRHPNIVTVYDVGEDGKRAWIAMDLVEGKDLGHHAEPKQLLPFKQLLPLMAQVAEALHYAHEKGVIHRDIKPANMLHEKGSGRIVVTDFGVASLQDASQTRTGTVLGSPSYMAPEQVNGKAVDGRADLYALGVSLYQLCTGQLPFQGDTLANVMYRITHEKCTPPSHIRPELPDELEAIILKAMQKQPGRRFRTGREMAQALNALLHG